MSTILKKIKAGALQYVLIISVIIAIILLGFIMLINIQQKVASKNRLYKEAITNVMNGFSYHAKNEIAYDQEVKQNFSANLQEETTLIRKSWGIFDLGIVASKVKKEYFSKVALMGWKTDKPKALYLKENNTPLIVVGKTKIVGNVYLPIQGIKTGNIAGNSFYGSQLFYGREFRSQQSMPTLKNKNSIRKWYNLDFIEGESMFFELEDGMELTNSFTKPTLVYPGDGNLTLRSLDLAGNIVINSRSKIVVERTANLKDLILIAPEIHIKKGVEGNFQCFARTKIIVEENCQLNYPTALTIFNKVEDKENRIEIGKKSSVSGCIVYDTETSKPRSFYTPQVIISENAIITGDVYCSASTEILGTVKGTVYTNNFLTKQSGSTYINHIYNGQILYNELHDEFAGLNVDSKNSSIVKWLY